MTDARSYNIKPLQLLLFVRNMLSAPLAILFVLQFPFNCFFIFASMVVNTLACFALQAYEVLGEFRLCHVKFIQIF